MGDSANAPPGSPAGQNADGMAPFGTYTKAMRVGARSGWRRARSELNAGRAMQAPSALEEVAAAEAGVTLGYKASRSCQLATVAVAWIRIFWNGADSMTPINNAEKRPSLALSRFTIPSMVSTS